jgi:ATP-dependent helicase/DNAse subunit B
MTIHLLVAPSATGKTQTCLDIINKTVQRNPLTQVWILVPDQVQANEMRSRLVRMGLILPARVETFGDLNQEILERKGCSIPVAGASMLRRLLQQVIRDLCAAGQLPYYGKISSMSGFQLEISDRIAELKRALVMPEYLAEVAQAHQDPGLIDLARIYMVYQTSLQNLGCADPEGLSWLAFEALSGDSDLISNLSMLVVDGFDDFNPTQLRTLQSLADRVPEIWITLPGTPEMTRVAYRRFVRGLKKLKIELPVEVTTIPASPNLPTTLIQLEASLFEVQVSPFAVGPDLTCLEVRSPAEEAREALRWIKARILRDGIPAFSSAIAVPQLDSYRTLLEVAAKEFGLPIRFSQGPLLVSTPAATAVLDLLSLALNDFPLRPLLDSIRSPYFDLSALGLPRLAAKPLEIASRYGQVVQGMNQWEEALNDLTTQTGEEENLDELGEEDRTQPQLPIGEQAKRLLDGLNALAIRLRPLSGEIPYKEWVLWLENLLNDLGFFDCTIQTDEEEIGHSLERILLALGRSEALTGPCPVDYPTFLKEWMSLISTTPLQEEEGKETMPTIRVLQLFEARGVRVQALAVLGLAEGSFPAIERPDPFISEAVRRELSLELRLGKEQAGLFYQMVTRADRFLLLTRPYLAKDGETWESSPYWNAVQELLQDKPTRIRPDDARPLNEAASSDELLFWAARRNSQAGLDLPVFLKEKFTSRWRYLVEAEPILAARVQKEASGSFDGGLQALCKELDKRYGERAGWSASRLEAYASCPFQFFSSSALGLEVLEAPQIGYQANQLGTILHAVLEQVYREAPDPANTAEVLAHLPSVAERVFADAPQNYQFRPSLLWEIQQEELMVVLEAAVQGIADLDPEGGWRPLAFECKFGMEGQPPLCLPGTGGEIRLHGVVDRVDVNSSGELRVIDYKSGGSHLTPRDLIEGQRLQLPIYAMAANQALGLGEPVEGFYWKLFQKAQSSLKLSSFEYEGGVGSQTAFSLAASYIEATVSGIREGRFSPTAPRDGCPDWCTAAAWCWHYQAGGY